MKKSLCSTLLAAACFASLPSTAMAAWPGSTVVPGQQNARNDVDGNNIADAGVIVNTHDSYKAYGCKYVVISRGDFGNTPYLDSGWIANHITCPDGAYNYLFVSQGDPRYTGNPDFAIWGTWEWVGLTVPGFGNIVKNGRAAL